MTLRRSWSFLIGGAIAASSRAEHVCSAQTVVLTPKSPVEKGCRRAIICMCGTCGRKRCGRVQPCDKAAEMRDEIARLTAAGKTRDEVVQCSFIAKYGSQGSAERADRSRIQPARLAVFPYVTGLAGVVVRGAVAHPAGARRPHAAAPAQEPGTP